MNKEKVKFDTEKKSSSTLNGEISNIDEIMSRILLKNKEKLDRIRLKEINIENFSLKNKVGNVLYFLKRKSNKKTRDDTDSKVLSEKKFSEVRENLSVGPCEVEEKTGEFGTIPEEIAIKKRIIFGIKDKKVVDKYSAQPPSTEDLKESKDFDKIVSEIDEFLKNKSPDKIDEDEARLVDEKLKESPKIDKSYQKKDAEVRENLREAPCEVEEKTEEFGTIPEEIAIKKQKKERREEPPALDEFIKEEKRYEKPFLDDEEKLLLILDELLEKLPDEVVDDFVQSEDFNLYEKVVSKLKRK